MAWFLQLFNFSSSVANTTSWNTEIVCETLTRLRFAWSVYVTEIKGICWMTTDGHKMLFLTMKIYDANPLIAVVLISLVLESTGQNTGMLKAAKSYSLFVNSAKVLKRVKWLKRLRVVTALKAMTTTTPFITICRYISLCICLELRMKIYDKNASLKNALFAPSPTSYTITEWRFKRLKSEHSFVKMYKTVW